MEIFVIPPLVIVFLMYLFLYAFRNPEKLAVVPLVICIIIFGLLSAGAIWIASTGDKGTLVAFLAVLVTTVVIVLAAIVLLIMLPKNRKLIAVALAIICPAILFASIQIGEQNTPERNADKIVKG